MTPEEIIQSIADNSLTVRCLPHIVTSKSSVRDVNKLQEGSVLEYWQPDLEYFVTMNKYSNGQKLMDNFYSRWGEKGRPFEVKKTKVEKGGWWYVKETQDTSSTVIFSRKYDEFFAPTLEEALQLYLSSKKIKP